MNGTVMRRPIRILGIDPGLAAPAGLVTIEATVWASSPAARSPARAYGSRHTLLAIHDGLRRVVAEHGTRRSGLRGDFVNKDASATLSSPARGIAMLVPAIAGLRVAEYAPIW